MPRDKEILRHPPLFVLGSLRADHENNWYTNEQGVPIKDPTGSPIPLPEKHRGGCFLLLILNNTEKLHAHEEQALRFAARTAHDVIRAANESGAAPRPFKKDQALVLFRRLHEHEPKISSLQVDAWCDTERYLNAYVGGDEVAARLRRIYDVEDQKVNPKIAERRKAEELVLEEIEKVWAGEVEEIPEAATTVV